MAETALAAPLESTTTSTISTTDGLHVTSVKLKTRQGLPLRCLFQSQSPDGLVVPLTNLHARIDIGERGGAALLSYDTAAPTPQFVLDAPNGLVTLYLGARLTRTLPVGALQFDLDLYDPLDPDSVDPFAQGIIIVGPEVGS